MVNAVVWREGLFIRPQHFQQNDRHLDYELRTRTRESGANQWGFFQLEIDQILLNSGKLVLKRAYGIMPDGTLFDITTKSNALIFDVLENDSGTELYLALPLSIHNADALSFDDDSTKPTRMVAVREKDVPNTNVGENSLAELLLAQHNFQILREEELNEGYDSIPLTRIASVSPSGIVSLDNSFMPTYLHLNHCEYLIAKCKDLTNVVNYRMDKLTEKLSDATIHATELGDYLLLQLLNRFHARFSYLIQQEKVHPQELFLELYSLIAELAVFMKKDKRLDTEYMYDHRLQKNSFDVLFAELKNLLSMVIEQNSVKLAIEERKYGIRVAKLEDKSFVHGGSFILAITASISTEKLKKALLANLKIGTVETIRDLVNYHLAGFKLKPLAVAPRQVPYRVNYVYFNIEMSPKDKEQLSNSGGFAFHLAGDIEGIEYSLWAIRNEQG